MPPTRAIEEGEGKEGLAKCPPCQPSHFQTAYPETHPGETTLLGVGDWLTGKDILCRLNQELCHMEIDEPHVWTLAFPYIKRLSKCMRMVESGATLDSMAWCCCHIFVVNSDDKEGSHSFVCAFNCCVRLERFIIWV